MFLGRLAGGLEGDVGLAVDDFGVDKAEIDFVALAIVDIVAYLINGGLGSGEMDGCNLLVLGALGLGGIVGHVSVRNLGEVPNGWLALKELVHNRLSLAGTWSLREKSSSLTIDPALLSST